MERCEKHKKTKCPMPCPVCLIEERDLVQAQNKQLRALKCPPISNGDTCICPIEELEATLIKKDERIKELEAENTRLREAIKCFLDRWEKSGPQGSAQWEKFGFSIQILEQSP